jgi:hypothetical protein
MTMVWRCTCAEVHEDTFDSCWNCGRARDGTDDPHFVPATAPPARERLTEAIVEHASDVSEHVGRFLEPPAHKAQRERRLAQERRWSALEAEVARLRAEVANLRSELADLRRSRG